MKQCRFAKGETAPNVAPLIVPLTEKENAPEQTPMIMYWIMGGDEVAKDSHGHGRVNIRNRFLPL